MEVFDSPLQDGGHGVWQRVGARGRGVLQLPALPVRRHDHVPGDMRGVGRAVVGAAQVQAQVDARGGPGAGGDIVRVSAAG
ncbi:hypothetical protein [Streptomyces auratus]|uniref:hypothetical protein n=1 Tax=Streptomyces auratus TaxID=114687 RepID=UPI0026B2D89A